MNKFVDFSGSCHAWRLLYMGLIIRLWEMWASWGPESWVLLDSPRFGHDWALYLDRLYELKTERTEPLLNTTTLSRANVDIDQTATQVWREWHLHYTTPPPLCLLQDTTLEARALLLVGWSHSSVIKLKNLCTSKVLLNWQTSSTHDGYLLTHCGSVAHVISPPFVSSTSIKKWGCCRYLKVILRATSHTSQEPWPWD
jgi:hypothetical protein